MRDTQNMAGRHRRSGKMAAGRDTWLSRRQPHLSPFKKCVSIQKPEVTQVINFIWPLDHQHLCSQSLFRSCRNFPFYAVRGCWQSKSWPVVFIPWGSKTTDLLSKSGDRRLTVKRAEKPTRLSNNGKLFCFLLNIFFKSLCGVFEIEITLVSAFLNVAGKAG